ncbi:MAG: LysR family transcriptional regulator substrate-binding protein, partial [Chroococcidiopsidaceae cyanobacterium CP_BM_RX_35]|nr:LysR family transcriptional regulator substrate-binding protein [Chroococcidiopsidaceae cyanobacterium CP_BM_RX_35]
ELADLSAGRQPELCIAAIPSLCAYYLPPVLQKFCHGFPDVQLRVTSLGSDRALKVLKDDMVDLAIVMQNRFLTTGPEMVVEVLFDEPIEVLMAANHPLTQYEQVPWSELTRFPQVVFKDGYGMQRLVQERFERLGAVLHATLEVNTLDAFRGVVRQGELLALLPHSALVEICLDPTLAVRSLAAEGNSLTRRVVMVTTQDRLHIPPIQHFWQLMCEYRPKNFDGCCDKQQLSAS